MDYGRIPLKIERKELKPGIAVLMMTGPIRLGPHCKQIEEQVEKLIAAGEKRLVFDLSGVYNLDSGGLGQIVACLSKLKKSGGFLRLTGVGGTLSGIFKMTHVDRVIKIYPTALAACEDCRQDSEA
jgi:anti-sigma B factor antagonist